MNTLQKAHLKCPAWKDAFRASSIRVGFGLTLTRTMAEFLSAVADDCCWDRSKYGSAQAFPDNFIATAAALVKRGLIVSKPADVREKNRCDRRPDAELYTWSEYATTEAGEHVVALLKLAGLFVETDAAIEKKARKK